MIRGLRITLYEIFGYALPGVVFLPCLGLFACWVLDLGSERSPICVGSISTAWLVALGLIAYLAGHAVHAGMNLLLFVFEKLPWTGKWKWIDPTSVIAGAPAEVLREVRAKLQVKTGIKAEEMTDNWWVLRLAEGTCFGTTCDEAREIYEYRNGFYRGLAIACAVDAVAIAIRALGGPLVLFNSGDEITLSRGMLLVIAAVFAGWSALSFRRYHLFETYWVKQLLASVLVGRPLGEKKDGSGD